MFSERSLSWLRELRRDLDRGVSLTPGQRADMLLRLSGMRDSTPAWTEWYDALAVRLGGPADRLNSGGGPLRDLVLGDDGPAPAALVCPQVVGVDFPSTALRRAVWINGSLHLGLDHLTQDRGARTEFRIVGAEPRVWWVSGMEDITTDISAHAVLVRVPRLNGDIEFAPGSY